MSSSSRADGSPNIDFSLNKWASSNSGANSGVTISPTIPIKLGQKEVSSEKLKQLERLPFVEVQQLLNKPPHCHSESRETLSPPWTEPDASSLVPQGSI